MCLHCPIVVGRSQHPVVTDILVSALVFPGGLGCGALSGSRTSPLSPSLFAMSCSAFSLVSFRAMLKNSFMLDSNPALPYVPPPIA